MKNTRRIFFSNFFVLMFCALLSIWLHYFTFHFSNMNVIDEMQYIFGILNGVDASAYPSPLFFSIFHLFTNENNIVLNSRLLNLVIFLLGLYPIYQLAKKYLNAQGGLLIGIFYLFSAFSFYITNVMPEIVFATFAYYLIFIFDKTSYKTSYRNLFFLALLVNLLAMIKNHGIFFVPTITLFIILKEQGIKSKLTKIALFVFCFIAIKFSADLLLNGEFHIFGKVYGQIFNSPHPLSISLITNAAISLIGNFLLFLPFMIFLIGIYWKNKKTFLNYLLESNFILFITLCLLCFICVTVFFSAMVSNNPGESIFRIHERYYSYLFVLFLVVVLNIVNQFKINKLTSITLITLSILSFVLIKFFGMNLYQLSYIDNPDLNVLYSTTLIIPLIFTIAFLTNFVVPNFLSFFIGTIIFASIFIAPKAYLYRSNDTPDDYAGKYVCANDLKSKITNVYVDNIVSFGFYYYGCPGSYRVHFFENFDYHFTEHSIYIGNFVYKNRAKFAVITRVNDYIFYK